MVQISTDLLLLVVRLPFGQSFYLYLEGLHFSLPIDILGEECQESNNYDNDKRVDSALISNHLFVALAARGFWVLAAFQNLFVTQVSGLAATCVSQCPLRISLMSDLVKCGRRQDEDTFLSA